MIHFANLSHRFQSASSKIHREVLKPQNTMPSREDVDWKNTCKDMMNVDKILKILYKFLVSQISYDILNEMEEVPSND